MRVGFCLLALLLLVSPASDAADTSKTTPELIRTPVRTVTPKPQAGTTGSPARVLTVQPSAAGGQDPGDAAPDAPRAPPRRRRTPGYVPWSEPVPEPTTEQVDQTGGSLLRGGSPGAPQARPSEELERQDAPALHEPGQVLVLHAEMSEAIAFSEAEKDRYRVRQRERLDAAGLVLTVLQARAGGDAPSARDDLLSRYPELLVSLNHRYSLSRGDKHYGSALVGWGEVPASCGQGLRLGVLDTLADTDHEALAGAELVMHSVLPPGATPAPADHGTAIAALLTGRPGGSYPGLLPAATVLIAGAFRERDDGSIDATADRLVVGLDWLMGQAADVVSFSFLGPTNPVFASVLELAGRRGVGLVAAVGNAGPEEAPGFPARLEAVIAVTAVDGDGQVYRLANQGPGIDLAAPGVDLWVPRPGRSGHYVSGTSFAVPFVASALARAAQGRSAAEGAAWLFSRARDLGPGETFGRGLLQLGADAPCD